MAKSLFERHIEALSKDKQTQEQELHAGIEVAVSAFVRATAIEAQSLFFRQNGNDVEISQLASDRGVMVFNWGVRVNCGGREIDVSSLVNAGKKTYHNGPDEIRFGVGEYQANGDGLEQEVFIKTLTNELLQQLTRIVTAASQ